MMKALNKLSYLGQYFVSLLPGVEKIVIHDSFIIINVEESMIYSLFLVTKKHSFFKDSMLLDIWGVDFPEKKKRFQINYLLASSLYNFRVIIRTCVQEGCSLSSIEPLYSSAGWLEREVWDMFGILFLGNKDLRRILTDYGFEGYPLRKDFPLSGFLEVRYDDTYKRVVEESLEITQEYRSFNFKSPWEN